MTPDQIKPGHTYEMKSETCWTVKSFVGNGGSIIITDGEVTTYDTPHNFARYAVRDVTPAPESDQGEKVAQAQSQGPSRGDGAERLPCPWCGGAETGITYNTVECSTCGAEGPPVMDGDDERMPTNAEVIAAWNRRTPPATDAVKGELLAALHGLLNALPSATTHPAIKAARAAIARAEAGE